MEGMGVEPIEAVGKEFNPDFHNAVMHVEDESVGENIVVEELQKGYTYKGFVVRHSMVKVANWSCSKKKEAAAKQTFTFSGTILTES